MTGIEILVRRAVRKGSPSFFVAMGETGDLKALVDLLSLYS